MSCTGFTDAVFVAFLELFSGRSTLESIDDLLTQYQLRWLGHVAWMPDTRYPKQMLFGWLPQKHPAHGPSFIGGTKFVSI